MKRAFRSCKRKERTDASDEYISAKVTPHVAHGAYGTTEEVRWVLERLPALGISIDNVAGPPGNDTVAKSNRPFAKLMATLAQRPPRCVTREP